MTIAVNRNLSNCENSPKKRFSGLQRDSNLCVSAAVLSQLSYIYEDHTLDICIPAIQIISFSVPFLSRVDELNKLASLHCTVFIAQLGEHCSANAEATGSNPVEAPKIFFSGYFRNCLNCDSLRWSHTHFTKVMYFTPAITDLIYYRHQAVSTKVSKQRASQVGSHFRSQSETL